MYRRDRLADGGIAQACLFLAITPSPSEPSTILPGIRILPGSMLRLLEALLPTVLSAVRSRRHMVIENLALSQQAAIVEPDTVVRWHRAGFRTYWNWLSRRGKRSGRSPLPRKVQALIRRMATENPWGAPRIHGELQCLAFAVSERSVSRYLRSF